MKFDEMDLNNIQKAMRSGYYVNISCWTNIVPDKSRCIENLREVEISNSKKVLAIYRDTTLAKALEGANIDCKKEILQHHPDQPKTGSDDYENNLEALLLEGGTLTAACYNYQTGATLIRIETKRETKSLFSPSFIEGLKAANKYATEFYGFKE